MKCPCKDCEKRYVGCHSKCSDYKDWSNYDKNKKAEEKRQKAYDWNDNYYLPSRRGKRKIDA